MVFVESTRQGTGIQRGPRSGSSLVSPSSSSHPPREQTATSPPILKFSGSKRLVSSLASHALSRSSPQRSAFAPDGPGRRSRLLCPLLLVHHQMWRLCCAVLSLPYLIASPVTRRPSLRSRVPAKDATPHSRAHIPSPFPHFIPSVFFWSFDGRVCRPPSQLASRPG